MAQEVSFVDNFIHDFVYDEREYIYKGELRKDIFPQPNSIRLCDQKNMPNYSTGLIQSLDYSIKHYGEVSGLIYRSYNAEVEYYVIKNRENKIWIAGINFVDNGSPITSYGVRSKALDYDYAQFVMPLWERSKYIHPDYRSEQKIPREEKYQSSWKYLVKINLIRSFYEDQFVDVPPDVN